MAEVLNFPVAKVRPVKRKKKGKSAEVLIFPGIRIERGEFSLSDRLLPTRRKRPRSTRARAGTDDRS
ncbi:MAG: hypothetical protein OER56_11635 [Hyphomicrobiales bacterium]|nr:hypothetical protein [Hyphomicrobiales bacterium]